MKFLVIVILWSLKLQAATVIGSSYELEDIVYTQESSTPDLGLKTTEENVNFEVLQQANITSLDDALRLTPSATTSRGPRSSGEAPQVRGLDKNKITVSIDGVPQNYQEGHTSMVTLDTETLKQVEVFKSSGDFSQFSSLGGGVVFKTLNPEDLLGPARDKVVKLKSQVSGANQERLLNLKSAFRHMDTSGLMSFTSKDARNLHLSDGTILENSSYKEKSFLGKIKKGDYGLSYSYFERYDDSPLDPSLNPPANITSLLSKNKTVRNSVSLSYSKESTNIKVYLNNHSVKKIVEEDKTLVQRSIQTIGTNISHNSKLWLYGTEIYHDRLEGSNDSQNISSYPNADSLTLAAFVQKPFHFLNVRIVPGLKLHHYKLSTDNLSFSDKSAERMSKNVIAVYTPWKNVEIVGSYSEGFNAPRVNEVYPVGLHSPGDDFFIKDNFFISNLSLTEETSAQWESGISLKTNLFTNDDEIKFKYSRYVNNVRDYIYMERIDRSVIDVENGTTQFVNIPKVRLEGEEASLHYFNNQWESSLTFTKVRGRNRTLDLYLEDLPADQLTFSITYYLDKYNFSSGYYAIRALDQNRVNTNTIQRTDATPGYTIHNIFIRKRLFNNLDANLRVENIGNTKYRRHASHLYESREDIRLAFQYKILNL